MSLRHLGLLKATVGTPPIASLQRLEDYKIGCILCSISPMFGSTGWKVTTKGIRSLPADCLLLRVSTLGILRALSIIRVVLTVMQGV